MCVCIIVQHANGQAVPTVSAGCDINSKLIIARKNTGKVRKVSTCNRGKSHYGLFEITPLHASLTTHSERHLMLHYGLVVQSFFSANICSSCRRSLRLFQAHFRLDRKRVRMKKRGVDTGERERERELVVAARNRIIA